MLLQSLHKPAQIFSVIILVGGLQACLTRSATTQQPDIQGQTISISTEALNLTLEEIASFPGNFNSFTPDGQGLVTYEYDSEGGQTRIFDINGTELALFTNTRITFAPNSQIMALSTSEAQRSSSNSNSNSNSDSDVEYSTHLMAPDGTEVASFQGGLPQFVFNEPRLITHDNVEDISRL